MNIKIEGIDLIGNEKKIILKTERLILRPYEASDAEAIYGVVSRWEIAETTVSIPHPYPRQNVDWWINFLKDSMEKGNAYEFGIFKRDEPHVYLGNCGFVSISKQHNNGELDYFINPDYWNQGYGTEACRRLVEFGFRELGLERIYGRCMTKNEGSRRIMEKAGLKYEGLAKHEIKKLNKYEDVWKFGLICSE